MPGARSSGARCQEHDRRADRQEHDRQEHDRQEHDPQGDGFETRAVHAGAAPDPASGAVVPPITLSTTFAQSAVGQHAGWEYGRSGNPSRDAVETTLASLEGAAHGLSFASGLAAEDAILRQLDPGDRVVLGADAYGGTFA